MMRLVEATGDGDQRMIVTALEGVMAITANQLDQGSRSELARLAQAIVA